MGFFDSFLGSFLGHAAAEAKKENDRSKRQNIAWNNQFDELSIYEEELNNLLKSVGSQEIYIFDANCIDAGRTNQEIRKINNYKEKIHIISIYTKRRERRKENGRNLDL